MLITLYEDLCGDFNSKMIVINGLVALEISNLSKNSCIENRELRVHFENLVNKN